MSGELLFVLLFLAACVAMFVAARPPMDVVALLVMVVLPLSGIVTVPEALAGFSDPNIVLIAALFVIGAGLQRTGVAQQLSEQLIRRAGSSETKLVLLLMLAVAGLGSVMSSTGVVAIFIPVALSLSERLKIPPGRLMMPLSFAGLMSGMQTLVATTPNMVIDSALIQEGHGGFAFFSFTPIGLVVLAAGILYMLVARRFLRAEATAPARRGRRSMRQYVEDYDLAGRDFRVRILPGSTLVGRAPDLTKGRKIYGASLIAVERRGRFRSEVFEPTSSTVLQAGDVLLLDLPRAPDYDREEAAQGMGLQLLPLRGAYFSDQSREVGMAEILIPPGSNLEGNTVVEANFRAVFQLHVIGLRRNNKAVGFEAERTKIKAGDTLLVVGTWAAVRQMQSKPADFLVMTLPAELDQVAPAHRQAPFALASLGVMILLMVTGVVPNVIAALIGCLLMGLFRCIDLAGAYKAINWPIMLLIVGVMPFAVALERTGGIALAVDGLLGLVGGAGPRVILASVFIVAAVISMFISNTATAVLMAPVAIGLATQLGASPYPFAMTLAIAASAAFMTPISSPVNMLVLAPGRYTFGDFVKIGVPFTLIVLVICVVLVPVLFPLNP